MSTRVQVAVVARDPGAAAALAPVVRALRSAGFDPYTSALTDAAAAAFLRAGTGHGRGAPPPADVLLSGTSTRPDLDADMWQRARGNGSRVIALVDHWTRLAERFAAGAPDILGVIDGASRQKLLDAGMAAERVVVMGHPALDDVVARTARRTRGGDGRVAFVSEPLSALPTPPPIDEHRGAALLCEALAEVPSPLVVRPHPREDPTEVVRRFMERGPESVSVLAGDPLPELSNVSAVLGMGSMLLVETALMGTPVAAIRTAPEAAAFPGCTLEGLIRTVSSTEECIAFLRHAADGSAGPDQRRAWALRHGIDGRATERVVGQIRALLEGSAA